MSAGQPAHALKSKKFVPSVGGRLEIPEGGYKRSVASFLASFPCPLRPWIPPTASQPIPLAPTHCDDGAVEKAGLHRFWGERQHVSIHTLPKTLASLLQFLASSSYLLIVPHTLPQGVCESSCLGPRGPLFPFQTICQNCPIPHYPFSQKKSLWGTS